jgi:hypothetical protein
MALYLHPQYARMVYSGTAMPFTFIVKTGILPIVIKSGEKDCAVIGREEMCGFALRFRVITVKGGTVVKRFIGVNSPELYICDDSVRTAQ